MRPELLKPDFSGALGHDILGDCIFNHDECDGHGHALNPPNP